MPQQPIRQARFRRPPGAADIFLVRHGESEAAVPGRPFPLVGGQGNPALAPEGRAQAARVAQRLASEQIDVLYVTTLRRTVETAAPLASLIGLEPEVEAGLREVHLGDWEGGMLREKVAAGDPLVMRVFEEQRWDVIPGAEPAEEFAGRVRSSIASIASANPDRRVAVFTHGGVIAQALAHATGSHPFSFVSCDNASVSQIVVHGERWTVRRFNDTAHLDGGLDLSAGGDGSADRPGWSVSGGLSPA